MNANEELVPVAEGRQIHEWKPEPEPDYLVPVMDLETAKRRLEQFQAFVRSYLVEGEDYGMIPGTKQNTLLKPGADKLCEIYGLAPTYPENRQKATSDWTKAPPYLKYTCTCVLVSKRTDRTVAEGIGNCNSHEKKYKYRWENGKRVVNTEIADQDNTILKMAAKRALVAAVISATRSSGIFTQDLEDISQEPPQKPRTQPRAPSKPQPKPQPQGTAEHEATLAGFKGCHTLAQAEQYWAHEMESAKQTGDTAWMVQLTNAKNQRKDELRKPREEPAEVEQHGLPGVFPNE